MVNQEIKVIEQIIRQTGGQVGVEEVEVVLGRIEREEELRRIESEKVAA